MLGILFLLICFVFIFVLFMGFVVCRSLWIKKVILSPCVPKLNKQDFKLNELRNFNGDGVEKRILIAVNGKVFDVTNKGQEFYGKGIVYYRNNYVGAPYEILAGRDASRALACFSTDQSIINDDYDDLSDLTADQMNSLREWELQFSGL